ncbi:MAG TPA: FAD-dependent oxidoreductase, partial [Candidatus Eisenbacteria bacterium]|nr:FAD-dependent oxidoreductase [Candidatus Eisenbacteria bacterium]
MSGEILIIGGGVVGLALGWRLRLGGARVSIVDRGICGRSAGWASAGLVQAAPDVTADRPALLALTLPAHRAWRAFAAELEAASGVPLGFGTRGVLVAAVDDSDDARLDAREARYRANGLPVERLTAAAARRKEWSLGPAVRGALWLKEDAWVNAAALGMALVEAFRLAGGRTYERETVVALEADGARVAGVRTRSRRIPADSIVIAAGAWSARLAAPELDPSAIRPSRGQSILLEGRDSRGAALLQRAVSSPSVWAVPQNDGALWAGGWKEGPELAGSFDAAPREETTARIREALERLIPGSRDLALREARVGHPARTEDGLPVLGASARLRGLYYAAGHHKAGILLADETARILAPLI